MLIEAVSVCVNFSDVLCHSLPINKHHFDRIIIVTDPADTATRKLCDHHYVECVATDAFYHSDQAFNKGRGINVGLAMLAKTGFVVHMDADIVLPARARRLWDGPVALDAGCIYGMDRLMCPDFTAWIRHMADPTIQHCNEIFVIPDGFKLGVRVAQLNGGGYLPIGFFQMWHPGASGVSTYPEEHGTAGRADTLHAQKWMRKRRVLMPEMFAIHLGSPIPKGKTNWRGRAMAPFGPGIVRCETGPGNYEQ